jgi:hypothetical protein
VSPSTTSATSATGPETLDAVAVRRRLLRAFTALFVGVMAVAGLPAMLSDVDSLPVLAWVATLAACVSVGMALAARHVLGPIERLVATGERLRVSTRTRETTHWSTRSPAWATIAPSRKSCLGSWREPGSWDTRSPWRSSTSTT